MFADDTNFFIDMSVKKTMEQLPKDIDRLGRWANHWQLTFNASTCTVMHIGYNNPHTKHKLCHKNKEMLLTTHHRSLLSMKFNYPNLTYIHTHIQYSYTNAIC